MRDIVPCLWLDQDLEEAVRYYLAVFPGSTVGRGARRPDGTLVSAEFTLAGHRFCAIGGGGPAPFTQAISFVVECDSQEEVDLYWTALTADGGRESRCGWLTDRFGVSWQIVPTEFLDMVASPDAEAVRRVVETMTTQHKMELEPLRAAFRG